MRIYGSIQTKFWTHSDIQNLTDQAKLLATYLLSSSHTNMLGCFRIPVGYVAEDLKWSFEAVEQALNELVQINYLTYDVTTSWVFIHSFLKFNPIENPNQGKSIAKIFEEIPKNLSFLPQLIQKILEQNEHLHERFQNYLETLSKGFANQDQEQDQEQNQNQEVMMSGKPDVDSLKDHFVLNKTHPTQAELKSQAQEVLEFLNEKTGRNYRFVDTNLNLVIARFKSGVTVGQCFQVIAKKHRDWKDDPKMSVYLRPETLFDKKKFESYLGELIVQKTNENAQ